MTEHRPSVTTPAATVTAARPDCRRWGGPRRPRERRGSTSYVKRQFWLSLTGKRLDARQFEFTPNKYANNVSIELPGEGTLIYAIKGNWQLKILTAALRRDAAEAGLSSIQD